MCSCFKKKINRYIGFQSPKKSLLISTLFVVASLIATLPSFGQNTNDTKMEFAEDACDELYLWATFGDTNEQKLVGEELLQPKAIVDFYTHNNCQPAWTKLSQMGHFIAILTQAQTPYDPYHLPKIDSLFYELQLFAPLQKTPHALLTKLDVLLTDAALQYTINLATNNEKTTTEIPPDTLIRQIHKVLVANTFRPKFQSLELDSKPSPLLKIDSSFRQIIVDIDVKRRKKIFDRPIHFPILTSKWYKKRYYQMAWHDGRMLNKMAFQLIGHLKGAYEEGLNPHNYHIKTIEKLLLADNDTLPQNALIPIDSLKKMDILLTDAALRYAWHLHHGSVNPQKMDFEWDIKRRKNANILKAFTKAVKRQNLSAFFDYLRPQNPQYEQLKTSLAFYRAWYKSKTWEKVPVGDNLYFGDEDERIEALNQQLAFCIKETDRNNAALVDTIIIQKDSTIWIEQPKQPIKAGFGSPLTLLSQNQPKPAPLKPQFITKTFDIQTVKIDSFFNPKLFDETLLELILDIQKQNGLRPDSIIGKGTLARLNTSPLEHIHQLKANLERWRWIHEDLGDHYVYVNLPTFELQVIKNKKTILNKKVVIGKLDQPTPIFNEKIRYVEINPSWVLPYSIALEEILPKLQRSKKYLKWHNMELYARGKKLEPEQADTINWQKVDSTNFHYTIRQKPNENNVLGTVKFLFPNRHSVYIHDTQAKRYFAYKRRAYSHGCIRLDRPMELANYLLKKHPTFHKTATQDSIKIGKNQRLTLQKPIPVYLLYFTTWVDDEGRTQFRDDIYKHDPMVLKAMQNKVIN